MSYAFWYILIVIFFGSNFLELISSLICDPVIIQVYIV